MKFLDWCQHECWQEVGILAEVAHIFWVELAGNEHHAKDLDIARQCFVVQFEAKVFKMFLHTARFPLLWRLSALYGGSLFSQHFCAESIHQSMNFLVSPCCPAKSNFLELTKVKGGNHLLLV